MEEGLIRLFSSKRGLWTSIAHACAPGRGLNCRLHANARPARSVRLCPPNTEDLEASPTRTAPLSPRSRQLGFQG